MSGRERRYKTPSLRTFRRLAGKSQREVAEEAGISTGFVSQLETGRRDAQLSTIDALAHTVYVELPDLLGQPSEEDLAANHGTPCTPCSERKEERPRPDRLPDGLPGVGERAVVTLSEEAGIVEERWASEVTALTYFRIRPDNLSFDLVGSSLTVRREGP